MSPQDKSSPSDFEEARIELRVLYPEEEPTLGVLASDLAQIDRALRDALRHARGTAGIR